MNENFRNSYLETQVLTASQPRLRLMLISGAIGNARETLRHWEAQRFEEAFNAMVRCQDIVFELMSSVNKSESKLHQQIVSMYLFLYKSLVEANRNRDAQQLENVIRVLEIDRETWEMVCEKMPDAPPASQYGKTAPEITAKHSESIPTPHMGHVHTFGHSPTPVIADHSGFSMDA